MITLFIGDNDEYLNVVAQAHDASAFLVDFDNWKKIIDQKITKDITIYTSLSDLPKITTDISVLWELIKISDTIYYRPPDNWSDYQKDFSWSGQKTLTEYYLYQAKIYGKNIVGMDQIQHQRSPYLVLENHRQSDEDSLWVAGCSISHGIGVNGSQKYGALLGQYLSRPTYHLTMGGSSLEWQADQILRSDIRKKDIVVWGLTQERRAPIAKNGQVLPWPDDTIEDVNYRLHETRYYKAITSVYQVINFCDKIQARLILLPLICSEKLTMDLIHHKDFYQPPYEHYFLDLGCDNLHPGPKQHQFWADFCLDIIKNGKDFC